MSGMSTSNPGSHALRAAFGHFPTGVAAVCARSGSSPTGMAVSTFVPVSLEPPLIAVCVQRSSRTWPVLRALPRLGISVLAEEHGTAARALSLPDNADRFTGLPHSTAESGAIRVAGSVAYFECAPAEEHRAGDHLLALLQVHSLDISEEQLPLLFHRSRFTRMATC
jgi:flavin reductase (DIM6/NTAB) family NADH-FMN oxidoreductase RutF